jgi:hypothetical protein
MIYHLLFCLVTLILDVFASIRVAPTEKDLQIALRRQQLRIGKVRSSITPVTYLRYCPLCVVEDQNTYGETYWHRQHQLSSIEVCVTHSVWLEQSDVYLHGNSSYISAETRVDAKPPRSLNPMDPSHQKYLRLAGDASWLLRQKNLLCEPQDLRKRYLNHLADCGLATLNGQMVRLLELHDEFMQFYPRDLFEQLQCELDETMEINWLVRLVRNVSSASAPIYHLLLIQFLGLTAQEFFAAPVERRPFGDGP